MLAEEALIIFEQASTRTGRKGMETVAQATPPTMVAARRALGRWEMGPQSVWTSLSFPRILVDARHEVVVTSVLPCAHLSLRSAALSAIDRRQRTVPCALPGLGAPGSVSS